MDSERFSYSSTIRAFYKSSKVNQTNKRSKQTKWDKIWFTVQVSTKLDV